MASILVFVLLCVICHSKESKQPQNGFLVLVSSKSPHQIDLHVECTLIHLSICEGILDELLQSQLSICDELCPVVLFIEFRHEHNELLEEEGSVSSGTCPHMGQQQHCRQQAQDSHTSLYQQTTDISTPLELDVRNVVVLSKENIGLIDNATIALLCGTPTKALLKWFPSCNFSKWLCPLTSLPSFVMTF